MFVVFIVNLFSVATIWENKRGTPTFCLNRAFFFPPTLLYIKNNYLFIVSSSRLVLRAA